MKKTIIFILAIIPFMLMAQSSEGSSSDCETINKVVKLLKDSKFEDLYIKSTEVKVDEFSLSYKAKNTLPSFTDAQIIKTTTNNLATYMAVFSKKYTYQQNVFDDQCGPYYNKLKNCFTGWSETSGYESIDDEDMSDLSTYTFTKDNIKAILEIYESLDYCEVTLSIFRY